MARNTKEEKKRKVFAKGKRMKQKEETIQKQEEDTFRFDDEIIIGVTKIEEPKKKNKPQQEIPYSNKKSGDSQKNNKAKKTKKKQIIQNKAKQIKQPDQTKQTSKTSSRPKTVKNKKKYIPKQQEPISEEERIKREKRKKKIKKIVGFTSLAIILVASTIAVMLSPIFNIQTITVQGNSQISTAEIISLSGITVGENIFKVGKGQTRENIKQNAYIDKVTINRNLPAEIQITVTERVATFMIEKDNQYLYMSNQGYLLELSPEKLELPILQGLETSVDDLVVGNRLCQSDLEKLEIVLRMVNLAKENDIASYITRIGIEDDEDYKLVMETEQKIVHMGDDSNLSDKMLNVKAILEKEKGVAGEIFVNVDLNKEYPMFRQNVNV